MGSRRGGGDIALGLLVSAAGTSRKHGSQANFAQLARSSSSNSWVSNPLVVSEVMGREHGPVAEDANIQAARYQLADSLIFGQAPSREEAVEAVSSIRQIFLGSRTPNEPAKQQLSNADWSQPRVLDALHLLRTSPPVERAVVSLASDSAVWDAIMKNESVKELRASFSSGEGSRGSSFEKVQGTSFSDLSAQALNWVFEITKAKLLEFAQKIVKTLDELLSSALNGKDAGHQLGLLEDALRSSLMLSLLVSIVVITARIHEALALTVV